MSDKIKKILPSDVISESMDKINDNFDILNGLYAVDEYKWQKYTKAIDKKIEELKGQSNAKSTDLANKIDQIKDMYDNLSEINNIQEQVKHAIINASEEMEEFIVRMAGEQISEKMGDYAKTSDIEGISAAFENFEASAEDQYASIINIAANSKFAKDSHGHLIDNITGPTECETIEAYYRTLSNGDKEEINPDGKDLDDPEVLKNLVAYCETHLKTVVTELTSITQTVTSDRAAIDLVATVSNNNPTASNLTAAIFMEANKAGSTIALDANNIKIISDNFKVNASGDHAVEVSGKITATSGTIGGITIASNAISASNFSVTSSGILTATNANITGAINATALTIQESGESKSIEDFVKSVGSNMGWGDTTGSSYSDGWLTNAFSKTAISGGLALTGNIFAADSNGSVTAGMMGAGTNGNDLRFFAGSDVTTASSAPFRVYEDGSFVATSAIISGDITADQFSATFTSASVTKNTVINGESFVISAAGSILDVNNNPVTISDNCLYIKIMDVVANTNPDINNGDGYLYGVPTLCMKYGNKEYILSPASWSDAKQMYPTDMRWQKYYDICRCVFNSSPSKSGNIYFDNGNGTVDTTVPVGTYYMFNDNPSNSYVTKTTDSVYKLNFTIDPRDQNVDTYAELLNQHNLISSHEVEVPDPVDPEDPYELVPDMDAPARTIRSRISGELNPQTRIAITDENCGVYENYLLDDDINIFPEISLSSSDIWEQSGTNWNLWKIGYILNNLMISILNRNTSKWTRGSSTNIHFGTTVLNPNTSTTGTYATSASAEMTIHIYPQLNMYNFATSSSTNKLLVECEFDTEVTYNGNPISEGDNGFNLYGGHYCLNYNFILDYDSWYINNIYEPFNDEDITDLYNKITSFLSNFDYSSIPNLAYSFSGSIWGSNQEDEFEYSVSEHKA